MFSGLDILVLSIIKNESSEKGISGYKLIKEINNQFEGMWKVSAGTIYPLLQRLNSKGFVEIKEVIEKNRTIKYYLITEVGQEKVKNVLDNNLESNFLKVLDYVRTVISSIPRLNFKEKFEEMCSCFPYHHGQGSCSFRGVDIKDDDLNLNEINFRIERLENMKKIHISNLERIEERIKNLKENKANIEKNIKTINISDDEVDF